MITICLTYYRSLTLDNLEASLYSVRQQDLSSVKEIVVVDNNTDDTEADIRQVIDGLAFQVPVRLVSLKHGDPTKTHAWSTNIAMREAQTPWVLFTRADYLLAFDAVAKFQAATTGDNTFIVGGYYDVGIPILACNQVGWREYGPSVLRSYGREYDHVLIDAGVWMTTRTVFDTVGGLDESLTAWGHAQTEFQYRVHRAGVAYVRLPEIVFYHPAHGYETPRDHGQATAQMQLLGVSVREMWARYEGPDNPYR